MPGPAEIMARWAALKFSDYIAERKNKKEKEHADSMDNMENIFYDSYYALQKYGKNKVFLMVWPEDVSNPLKRSNIKSYIIKEMISDPSDLPLWADACLKSRNFDKALLFSEIATEIDPVNSEAWNVLGMVLVAGKEYEKSKECFQKALQCDSRNKKAKENLDKIRNAKFK